MGLITQQNRNFRRVGRLVTWDGTDDTARLDDIRPAVGPVMVIIDNTDADQNLTAHFGFNVGDSRYDWHDDSGTQVEITINAGEGKAFGPFASFPKCDSGYIDLTMGAAPTEDDTTVVILQEV